MFFEASQNSIPQNNSTNSGNQNGNPNFIPETENVTLTASIVSPYVITESENADLTDDTIIQVAQGDFEPEARKLQAANLKNFKGYIGSEEFSKSAEIIGNPPNYQKGWTIDQVQASYVDEIRVDVGKANDELLNIYRRMVNFQLYNMLDMYYKVEFDSDTIDAKFLENSILDLWNLRKSIVDECKRRGL